MPRATKSSLMKGAMSLVPHTLLKISTASLSFILGIFITYPVNAALVDLTSWTAEGSGNWTIAANTQSVFQSTNGLPTVFYSDFNGQGTALSGKIKVETTSDDDFIGFVLGCDPGEITSNSTDFILIDWKQANQSLFGCTGLRGLAISHVTGGLPDSAASWCHNGSTTELARATNLGSTGWADNTEYSFDLIFTATNIQVMVNGVTELNISGSFSDGRFGFYNYSQQSVRYSAIEEDVLPPSTGIPEPGTVGLLGLGLAGMICFGRKRRYY